MKSRFLPYSSQYIDYKDNIKVSKILKSKFITQGPEIKKFENKFAKYVGSKYAVARFRNSRFTHVLFSFRYKFKIKRTNFCYYFCCFS